MIVEIKMKMFSEKKKEVNEVTAETYSYLDGKRKNRDTTA